MVFRLRAIYAGSAALVLIALAFFLRVYRLADKNIWWDEGWTVWLARHDFAWIALRTASDEHPPLHYWLMNVWQSILGTEAFTGRFFSLLLGVLLVALVYRIGKQIGGVRLGFLAALFLAVARFNVWWSQDIKNYTLSAFFAWSSVWFTWQIANSRWQMANSKSRIVNRVWLHVIGYILAAFLALFSHYLAALILIANNLFVGIVLLAMWRRGENFIPLLIRWVIAQLSVAILFAPWLYIYLQNGATWSAAPTFDFGLFLRLAATVLTLGVTTFIENYTWLVIGLLLIAALSLGWLVRPQLRFSISSSPSSVLNPQSLAWGTTYMLLIALIPPALIYALSLTPAAIFAPKIQARYLMMLTPAVAMLLALGILFIADNFRSRVVQIIAAALVAFIIVAQLSTLVAYYGERQLYDEYFSLTQMINNFGFDNDAIVLNTDQEYPTVLYYLKRPFAWAGVPNGTRVADATAAHVAADALQHNAVWVVSIPDALQQDPMRLVEQKIAARLPKQYEQTFGDKRLALFSNTIRNVKDVPSQNFSPQTLRDDTFDARLKLVGVDVPVREAMPGDVVSVVTYWEAQDLTTINLSLQTSDGNIVARAAIPISIGAHERAQGDLQVPPRANADDLQIVAQARLRALPIGALHILPRANVNSNVTDAAMQPHTERFGQNIALKGVSLPQNKFRAGENVQLTLFWQTDVPISTSYTVFVHLLGTQYNPAQNNLLWGQIDRLPLDGKLPTTAWTPGQTIADPYQVKLADNAPAGGYRIEIGLYDATGTRLRVFDANGNDAGDSLIVGEIQVGN